VSRKSEITQRLKEISKAMQPLTEEEMNLNQELKDLRVKEMLDSGVLSQIKWKFTINQKEGSVLLEGPRRYEPKELFAPSDWEHDHITVGKAEIIYSDGEAYIRFDSIKLFKHYKEKWNLDVDYSALEEAMATAKETFEDLQELKEGIR